MTRKSLLLFHFQMIPVMLFGVLFAHKRYSLREYICVALITIGILIFNLSSSHSKVREITVVRYTNPSCVLKHSVLILYSTTACNTKLLLSTAPTYFLVFVLNLYYA